VKFCVAVRPDLGQVFSYFGGILGVNRALYGEICFLLKHLSSFLARVVSLCCICLSYCCALSWCVGVTQWRDHVSRVLSIYTCFTSTSPRWVAPVTDNLSSRETWQFSNGHLQPL